MDLLCATPPGPGLKCPCATWGKSVLFVPSSPGGARPGGGPDPDQGQGWGGRGPHRSARVFASRGISEATLVGRFSSKLHTVLGKFQIGVVKRCTKHCYCTITQQ